METVVPYRGKMVKVNPDNPPKDTRNLRGFLLWNDASDCFVRAEGGWYKVTKENGLKFVAKTLSHLSLKEFLEIALNDNF
jgi:hypothetical protein